MVFVLLLWFLVSVLLSLLVSVLLWLLVVVALLQLLVADQTFITTAADMSPIDSDVVHLVIDGGVVQPS